MPAADKRARKKENARVAREAREAAFRRRKRVRSTITVAIVVLLFAGAIVIASLFGGNEKKKASTVARPAGCVDTAPKAGTKATFPNAPEMSIDPAKKYVAKFSTTCGDFDVTLDATDAPKTVNSFVFLAKKGFYDGLKFHRVAKDFVVQGGDPQGNGKGGPGYALPTEPPPNGYHQGSVAMANGGPNTTGSQFFITLSDAAAKSLGGPPYLFSALGDITTGFDVVQKLGSLYNRDQNPSDSSTQKTAIPLYIFKVTITES